MQEISFRLTVDQDGWPPVSVEHLRIREIPEGVVVESVPFFVTGISVGDLLSVERDVEGFVEHWETLQKSEHSSVWLMGNGSKDHSEILNRLLILKCNIETLTSLNFHAVDVPNTVQIAQIDEVLADFQKEGGQVAYPSFRH